MKNTLIFDMDGTLIYTTYHYKQANARELNYFTEFFRGKTPDLDKILEKYGKIDTENVKIYGFSMKRFPTSWAETFEYFCKEIGKKYNDENLADVKTIAEVAFTPEYDLMEGVEEVLEFLREKGEELFLLTKGDYEFQMKKVVANKLERWFEKNNVIIVSEKNADVFRNVIEGREKERSYSIGNSYKSDISPAIEIGMNAIFIPKDLWEYEKADIPFNSYMKNMNIFVLDDILEMKSRYKEIFG